MSRLPYSGLSPTDIASLSNLLGGADSAQLSHKLDRREFESFKKGEVLIIIKYIRDRAESYKNNPIARSINNAVIGKGVKKVVIIDSLRRIIQEQELAHRDNERKDDSSSSSMHNPLQQQQYRAQLAAQQHHAQQLAAHQQQSSYPRVGFNAPSSASALPQSSIAMQQQLYQQQQQQLQYAAQQQSYQQQLHQHQHQQYGAYTAANPNDFTQYSRPNHPHQLPSSSSYNNYAANSAAALAAHASTVAASAAATHKSDLFALRTHPKLALERSPYEHIISLLGDNLLNETTRGVNLNTGAPGGAFHTSLTFSISPSDLAKMKRSGRPCQPGHEHLQIEVHLRLFSSVLHAHHAWEKCFRVYVNGSEVPIPEPRKLSKSKKKGLELVRGLDISEYVQLSNTIEVGVFKQTLALDLFKGLVQANMIRIKDVKELMETQGHRIKEEESKMQATALERKCVICQSAKDPLRCSRCKEEWYCSAECQRSHWSHHRLTCSTPTAAQDIEREAFEKKAAQNAMLGPNGRTKLLPIMKVKREESKGAAAAAGGDSDVEDGIEEVDTLVSLKCPLSLERCEHPARGIHCAHLPCFNLETFLMFSQQSGVWQW